MGWDKEQNKYKYSFGMPPMPQIQGSNFNSMVNPNYGSQNLFSAEQDFGNFQKGIGSQPMALGNLQQPSSGGFGDFLGSDKFQSGMNAALGMGQAYMGYKQLQQAQDMFDFQRDSFNKQYEDKKRYLEEDRATRRATAASWN